MKFAGICSCTTPLKSHSISIRFICLIDFTFFLPFCCKFVCMFGMLVKQQGFTWFLIFSPAVMHFGLVFVNEWQWVILHVLFLIWGCIYPNFKNQEKNEYFYYVLIYKILELNNGVLTCLQVSCFVRQTNHRVGPFINFNWP